MPKYILWRHSTHSDQYGSGILSIPPSLLNTYYCFMGMWVKTPKFTVKYADIHKCPSSVKLPAGHCNSMRFDLVPSFALHEHHCLTYMHIKKKYTIHPWGHHGSYRIRAHRNITPRLLSWIFLNSYLCKPLLFPSLTLYDRYQPVRILCGKETE